MSYIKRIVHFFMYSSKLKFNTHKVTILAILAIFIIGFFGFGSFLVVKATSGSFGLPADSSMGSEDIRLTIAKIIRVVLGFLGLVALLITLYGGFVFFTAKADDEEIANAKKIMINGGIGFAIILSSFAVTQFVINKLGEATMFTGTGNSAPTGCADPAYAAANLVECNVVNSLPVVSDSGRSPFNAQGISNDYAFSWTAWDDSDGDPIEYDVVWYTNSNVCVGENIDSNWISVTTWNPTGSSRVCGESADSWQLRARDAFGMTTFNSCYSVEAGSCPTCSDGIQNGNEIGADCGGSCPACAEVEFITDTATGDESSALVNVNVSLSGASSQDIVVPYSVTGTATGGGFDYTILNNSITIPANSLSANIRIIIMNDVVYEPNETIILTLSNPIGATLGTKTVYTYTITDNETSSTDFSQGLLGGAAFVTSTSFGKSVAFLPISGNNYSIITIPGSTAGAQTDYQIKLNFIPSNLGAGTNLHFIDLAGTNLSSFIESWSPSTSSTVWIKVPNISASPRNTLVYMSYSGDNASSYATTTKGHETFILFDDFEEYSLGGFSGSATWNPVSNSYYSIVSINNNKAIRCNIIGPWLDGFLYAKGISVGMNISREYKLRFENNNTFYSSMLMGGPGNGYGWGYRNWFGAYSFVNQSNAWGVLASTPQLSSNTWHTFRWDNLGGTGYGYLDEVLKYTGPTLTGSYQPFLYYNYIQQYTYFDDVKIYKKVSPDPNNLVTIGSASPNIQTYSSPSISLDTPGATTISWSATSPLIVIKVRSSSTSDFSSASDWTTCNTITSGTLTSGSNCVNASDRFIQYQASLSSTNFSGILYLNSVVLSVL